MHRSRAKTPVEFLIYMTDCTLATVHRIAIKRRRPKYEYARQISIAQYGCDKIKELGGNVHLTRIADVKENGWSVENWAATFHPPTDNQK